MDKSTMPRGAAKSLPLFDRDAPPQTLRPADQLLSYLLEAVRQRPHVCSDSALTISSRLGLSVNEVRQARRQLVEDGVIILDRPPGLTPRAAFLHWPSRGKGYQVARRLPLDKHLHRVMTNLKICLFETAQLARLMGEVGRDSEATELAGLLEATRPMLARLDRPENSIEHVHDL